MRECVVQALRDVQAGTRILYVICAEGKANKNITIANLVGPQPLTALLASITTPDQHAAC